MDDKWLVRGEIASDSTQENVYWRADNLDKRQCFFREAQVISQIHWGDIIEDWIAGSAYENECEPDLQGSIIDYVPEYGKCLPQVRLCLFNFLRSAFVV